MKYRNVFHQFVCQVLWWLLQMLIDISVFAPLCFQLEMYIEVYGQREPFCTFKCFSLHFAGACVSYIHHLFSLQQLREEKADGLINEAVRYV